MPRDFKGHDFDMRHFVTPRTCDGFYVDRNKGDRVVGRTALIIAYLLLAAIWVGWV